MDPPSNSFYEEIRIITRLVSEFPASLKLYSSMLSSQKQLLHVTLIELNKVLISTPYVLGLTLLLPRQINLIPSIQSAVKAGRPRVRSLIWSLGFFIDLILPTQGSTQPVTEMSRRDIPWRVKAASA